MTQNSLHMLSSEKIKKKIKGKRTIYFLITVVNDIAGSPFLSDGHLSLRELQICLKDNFITISIFFNTEEGLIAYAHKCDSEGAEDYFSFEKTELTLWFDFTLGAEYTQ